MSLKKTSIFLDQISDNFSPGPQKPHNNNKSKPPRKQSSLHTFPPWGKDESTNNMWLMLAMLFYALAEAQTAWE